MRFVAVGELLVDVVASGSGHDARVDLRAGGSACGAALHASRAGADATVVGAVGDDAGGRLILAELARRGVAAEVTTRPGSTGAFLDTDGEIRVQRGVSREVDLPPEIEADVVLVSGYLRPRTIEAALARARARWVALDAARLETLPQGGNALVANAEAARRLTGADPRRAASMLSARYRLVCVTDGPAGAVAALDGRIASATVEPVEARAVGAGDAFSATLLVRLAAGIPLDAALAEACERGRAVALAAGAEADR